MRLCKRGLDVVQLVDGWGGVELCAWANDGYIGSLLEHSFDELYHGDAANNLRNRLAEDDYCGCRIDACPYLSCGTVEENKVEVDEIPQYPESLWLAYENGCNYNCTTCIMHERMEATDKTGLQERYDIIEDRIKEVLPHVKMISANGRGELFVSKRILKILQDWKPLAPPEEVSVLLETNGSLFDEEHFKQIANLGQYNLKVALTVMSFDEYTYQLLSGTKLPISKLENNLRYVKSLREQGVINYLELATVVQDRNFRQLPEFTRRCIEEFGADVVRLRSFEPWGKKPIDVEWYTDVRNKYHPYHQEYLEIMKDPIFKHPKVYDWSGDHETQLGEHPYKKNWTRGKVFEKMVCDAEGVSDKIKCFADGKKLAMYGSGNVAKALMKMCDLDCAYFIDKYNGQPINNCETVLLCEMENKERRDEKVIVTTLYDGDMIKKELMEKGFEESNIIPLEKLLEI
jgi:uncharacterized Fe-S cluster-containing radical SAM superfamily protein